MSDPRDSLSTDDLARAEVPERDRRLDARARVLVVEDEHELRHLIVSWLESNGYVAVEAADGEDAIELVQAGLRPDAIVLDLALPNVSGQAFLEWLRARPDAAVPPVIVSSGEHDDLRSIDVAGVLAKPYRPDLLLKELDRVIRE